jgi:hypothetical protein
VKKQKKTSEGKSQPVHRKRKPTNLTINPVVREAAKSVINEKLVNDADLSHLVERLLLEESQKLPDHEERLRAAAAKIGGTPSIFAAHHMKKKASGG